MDIKKNNEKGRKVLITGNAGFVGTVLTQSLLDKNYEVKGLDMRPRTDSPRGFTQIEGNILDVGKVAEVMQNIDCVIHLAAAHKDYGITESEYFTVNKQGTKILLEEASKANIKKFIFYSSVAVYGAQSNTTEATIPLPNNPYGASKLAAEKLVYAWAEEDATRTAIIIRPTVIFGARNQANIFRLIRQVCDGHFLMVGNGNNIKSVAFVRNVVDATLFLLNKCHSGIHVYNYSDEPHLTTRKLVELIAKVASRKAATKFYIPVTVAGWGGFIFDVFGKLTGIDFPITAARMKKFAAPTHHRAENIRELGFVPRYSIEEGLIENINWYRKQL